jgi:hypothetical protein
LLVSVFGLSATIADPGVIGCFQEILLADLQESAAA